MIYKGPGYLAVIWLGSSLSLLSPVSKLPLFLSLPVCRHSSLYSIYEVGGGVWARSQIIRPREILSA
jgi:hypothetical protein